MLTADSGDSDQSRHETLQSVVDLAADTLPGEAACTDAGEDCREL